MCTVSIIIPTFNRRDYITIALDSVMAQTYTDYEIIVVDDGSNDNTREVVKKFRDNRIRYIRHPENKGCSAARNTGIKMARLKKHYNEKVLPKLMKEFKYSSVMEVPRLTKVTVNIGVGEAIATQSILLRATFDEKMVFN